MGALQDITLPSFSNLRQEKAHAGKKGEKRGRSYFPTRTAPISITCISSDARPLVIADELSGRQVAGLVSVVRLNRPRHRSASNRPKFDAAPFLASLFSLYPLLICGYIDAMIHIKVSVAAPVIS